MNSINLLLFSAKTPKSLHWKIINGLNEQQLHGANPCKCQINCLSSIKIDVLHLLAWLFYEIRLITDLIWFFIAQFSCRDRSALPIRFSFASLFLFFVAMVLWVCVLMFFNHVHSLIYSLFFCFFLFTIRIMVACEKKNWLQCGLKNGVFVHEERTIRLERARSLARSSAHRIFVHRT